MLSVGSPVTRTNAGPVPLEVMANTPPRVRRRKSFCITWLIALIRVLARLIAWLVLTRSRMRTMIVVTAPMSPPRTARATIISMTVKPRPRPGRLRAVLFIRLLLISHPTTQNV